VFVEDFSTGYRYNLDITISKMSASPNDMPRYRYGKGSHEHKDVYYYNTLVYLVLLIIKKKNNHHNDTHHDM
jgi:hypothetical protein